MEGRVEGEEPEDPGGGRGPCEQGGKGQIQNPHVGDGQRRKGPGPAGQPHPDGPEQHQQHHQQGLVPQTDAKPKGMGPRQEPRQQGVGDSFLLQQAAALEGRQGVKGLEETGYYRAVEDQASGNRGQPRRD